LPENFYLGFQTFFDFLGFFQKNFYFRNRGVFRFFNFFAGKISFTALSPLSEHPKTPYIRGDVRGGGGTI
jgi:hypothetical protein